MIMAHLAIQDTIDPGDTVQWKKKRFLYLGETITERRKSTLSYLKTEELLTEIKKRIKKMEEVNENDDN